MTAEIEVYLENGGMQVDAQVESFRGPQGERGSQGEPGPQGERGEPGNALYNYALNGDFTRFVAQAGIGKTHCGSTAVFAGDAWVLAEGTLTAESRTDAEGYTLVCLNGTIRQKLEEKPAGAGFAGILVSSGEAAVAYDAENGVLEITGTQAVLERVWLCDEEVHTPPGARGYAAELMLCQRRYLLIPAMGEMSLVGYAFTDTTARFTLNLPIAMRLNDPTLQISYRTNVSIYPVGIMPSLIGSAKVMGTICAIMMYASGFTPGQVLVCKPNAKIELSCDLL